MTKKKRILICTFSALASGLFGGLLGMQINLSLLDQKCQHPVWNLKLLCTAWDTPGTVWQGGITGLWVGIVLGSFVGGSVTAK